MASSPPHRRLCSVGAALVGSGTNGLSAQRQAEAERAPSAVTLTVDTSLPGKHWGSIVVPWSDDRGAWANKLVPICVINGPLAPGSTDHAPADSALLFAGNHGKHEHRLLRAKSDQPKLTVGFVLLALLPMFPQVMSMKARLRCINSVTMCLRQRYVAGCSLCPRFPWTPRWRALAPGLTATVPTSTGVFLEPPTAVSQHNLHISSRVTSCHRWRQFSIFIPVAVPLILLQWRRLKAWVRRLAKQSLPPRDRRVSPSSGTVVCQSLPW